MVLRYDNIKKYASEAGFTLCGVARARVLSEHAPRFAAGLAASGGAALSYLVRDPSRRIDPSTLVPGARTVVVCALRYDGRPLETPGGKVSAHRLRGGEEADYQPVIKGMLREVLERLRGDNTNHPVRFAATPPQEGNLPALRAKVCCDTSAILEKAWAVEAGLGWIGRNSLLVNPVHGSLLLLGEIILDAECDRYDEPLRVVGCGACRRCVDNCPTGALGERTVDTGRCIAALTIERARKGLPVEPMHGWICGCDECQCRIYVKKTFQSEK